MPRSSTFTSREKMHPSQYELVNLASLFRWGISTFSIFIEKERMEWPAKVLASGLNVQRQWDRNWHFIQDHKEFSYYMRAHLASLGTLQVTWTIALLCFRSAWWCLKSWYVGNFCCEKTYFVTCEDKLLEKQTQDISLFPLLRLSSKPPFSTTGTWPFVLIIAEKMPSTIFLRLFHVSLLQMQATNPVGFFSFCCSLPLKYKVTKFEGPWCLKGGGRICSAQRAGFATSTSPVVCLQGF